MTLPTPLDRRRFLLAGSALFGSVLAGSVITGCATNPVSGKPELMLLSPDDEQKIDRLRAPIQISADFGPIDDPDLAAYVTDVGARVAATSHRKGLPWSFTPVDAYYLNAYTFPAGSVGITRGLLLELSSEGELAALLGHEIGHVNARHAAARMSADRIARMVVEGAASLISMIAPGVDELTDMTYGLGGLGSGLVLAKYSRDDEREADRLGMAYMVKAGYAARGMVTLLDRLQERSDATPGLLTTMFATHPMSRDRYAVARRREEEYAPFRDRSDGKEAYMEATSRLRRYRGAIVEGGKGEVALQERRFDDAERHLAIALKRAPEDYPIHLLTARLRLAQKRPGEALVHTSSAMAIKPGEPQAWQVRGLGRYMMEEYEGALVDFMRHEKALPGEGSSVFMQGICHERMGQREEAVVAYRRYLAFDTTSRLADYATRRIDE